MEEKDGFREWLIKDMNALNDSLHRIKDKDIYAHAHGAIYSHRRILAEYDKMKEGRRGTINHDASVTEKGNSTNLRPEKTG